MNRLRRRSVKDLPPAGKLAAYLVLVGWAVVVLFPLYWLVITSFKLPIQVNSGPVYLPFVDFQPSLDAWRYIFVDLRSDTFRPYVNTVVVALGSSTLALALGSAAAYALIRFPYKPRVGVIALLAGCLVLAAVAVGGGMPPVPADPVQPGPGLLGHLPADPAAGRGGDPDLRALPAAPAAGHSDGAGHH